MTVVPGESDGFDVDLVIPPNDTVIGIDLLPMEAITLDMTLTPEEDALNLILGGDGPVGPAGATGPAGRSIVITESPTPPTGPQAGDIWVQPGVPKMVRVWDGVTWQDTVNGPTGPTGPQGLLGQQGLTGPTGPSGPAGASGENWFYGATPPTGTDPPSTSTTNLFTNPSAELDQTGWGTLGGCTLSRSTARARYGAQSYRAVWATGAALSQSVYRTVLGLVPGQSYTFSVHVYVPTGNPAMQLKLLSEYSAKSTVVDGWQRLTLSFTASNTQHDVEIKNGDAATAGQEGYFDAVQVEIGSASAYFDGDTAPGMVGSYTATYAWTGTAHASTSVRTAASSNAKVGDWYLDANGNTYELLDTGWLLRSNLRGPTGPTGPQGTGGAVGPTGPTGSGYVPPDTGWITPTLLNSWVAYGSAWSTPAYRKIGNVVYIKGLIKGGTITTGTTLFTLPVGYRPLQDMHIRTVSAGLFAYIQIYANGDVKTAGTTSATYLSIDAISFPADQ
jgi:hypothetical protein